MSYPYFFIEPRYISQQEAILRGDDFRHLKKVLRASVGDRVEFSDNSGYRYRAQVSALKVDHMLLSLLSKQPVKKEIPSVTLFQCILKKNAIELLIQKACEIGVESIIPVYSRRVVGARGKVKTVRWQKIARQACMQSKRNFISTVSDPLTIEKVEPNQFDNFWVPYEQEGTGSKLIIINPRSEKLACLIGPEGGFEHYEVESLQKRGAEIIGLGQNILRAETAALYMLSVIDYMVKNEIQ